MTTDTTTANTLSGEITTKTDNDDKEIWTIEALAEELCICLAKKEEVIVAAANTENCGKQLTVKKYYRQAHELIYRIPIWKPSPAFTIYISDLTPQVKIKLDEIATTNPEALSYILKQAAGRIFENLDFEYYHLSIARKLRVRLEK